MFLVLYLPLQVPPFTDGEDGEDGDVDSTIPLRLQLSGQMKIKYDTRHSVRNDELHALLTGTAVTRLWHGLGWQEAEVEK